MGSRAFSRSGRASAPKAYYYAVDHGNLLELLETENLACCANLRISVFFFLHPGLICIFRTGLPNGNGCRAQKALDLCEPRLLQFGRDLDSRSVDSFVEVDLWRERAGGSILRSSFASPMHHQMGFVPQRVDTWATNQPYLFPLPPHSQLMKQWSQAAEPFLYLCPVVA